MQPIFLNEKEVFSGSPFPFFGIAELTTDEQIAKKIYQATGDKIFKGFLPLSWNSALIVKMRNARDILRNAGKLKVINMQMRIPEVSAAAHDYFIRNSEAIKGILPENVQLPTLKSFNPLFIAAGLAAAAVLFISVKPYLPSPKAKK